MRSVFALSLLLASPVLAHIGMEAPLPRFDDGQNKWCPCGTGGDGTRANADCSISSSDPNRGGPATVNTFDAGETITVRFREDIGHTGRNRIAFDPDGADIADFNANILADVSDPSGSAGNTGEGNLWEVVVTLPDTPCDNCTLQLIQDMNGDPNTPVTDPTGDQTYFQCADLVLLGAEGEGEGEGDEGGADDPPPGCAHVSAEAGALSLALLVAARRRKR